MTTDFDRPMPVRRKRRGSVIMVWLFLVLGGGVLGVFMLQASGFDIADITSTSDRSVQASSNSTEKQPPVVSERFAVQGSDVSGFDDDSQPYKISAVEAKQDTSSPNLVHMRTVSGLLRRPDGKPMDITAKNALFNSKDKSLRLTGQVTIKMAGSFTANMDTADIDVKSKVLTSGADVLVLMDGGQITSTGIKVTDNGAHVIFKTRVRAIFESNENVLNVAAPTAQTTSSKGNLQ